MSIQYQKKLIDRLQFAAKISVGKRVLDIGGQHPMNHASTHPFGACYRKIVETASQYEVFDRDEKPGVTYMGDLNTLNGQNLLAKALAEYQPQVILCMEILEHLNYPCAVMDMLALYIQANSGVTLFLTLPNNGNWILNAMNWHADHNVAFFRTIAMRFVGRSELGQLKVTMYPCIQRYKWYWLGFYLMALGQPVNWGFLIERK